MAAGFIALFSYSLLRYMFSARLEGAVGQVKILILFSFILFVAGIGVSNCSEGSILNPVVGIERGAYRDVFLT